MIEIRNVVKEFDSFRALDGLNMTVPDGAVYGLVGPNGAGKSTLIKTLLHLQEQQAGTIMVGDGLKPYEIGYLPQQTVVQRDFPATVWEIVLSGTLAHGGWRPFYTREQKTLAEEQMKVMGIADLKKQCYRHLSGGQQQRVLLARALCAASKIILLDEPVTGLDPRATMEFYGLLKELNEKGITVIMVSHDLQALSYASHVLHIDRDDSFFGTRKEYLRNEKSEVFRSTGGEEK